MHLPVVAYARTIAVYRRRRGRAAHAGCMEGKGQVEFGGVASEAGKGDVFLLPAVLGPCTFRPREAVNVLEIEIPE